MVAGVVALMLSVNPSLSASDVKTLLKNTARKINSNRPPQRFVDRWGNGFHDGYDADGHSRVFGWGLVDAGAGVRAAVQCGSSPALDGGKA